MPCCFRGDAIAVVVEAGKRRGLLQAFARSHLFRYHLALRQRCQPADYVTVPEELRRVGVLDASGGAAAVIVLQANTPAISSVGRYARIVEEHALLRRLIGVAHEIAEIGYEVPLRRGRRARPGRGARVRCRPAPYVGTVRSLKDLLTESLERLDHLYDRGDTITGVPTGYSELDSSLGPAAFELVVVGARPSMGKTAFALGLAAHAASNHGVPVLFFSLEMSHLEIAPACAGGGGPPGRHQASQRQAARQ